MLQVASIPVKTKVKYTKETTIVNCRRRRKWHPAPAQTVLVVMEIVPVADVVTVVYVFTFLSSIHALIDSDSVEYMAD